MKFESTLLPSPSGGRGTTQVVDEDVKPIKKGTESLNLMNQTQFYSHPASDIDTQWYSAYAE